MEKRTEQHTIIARMAIRFVGYFLNPVPRSPLQYLIKLTLKHFSALRKAIISYANSVSEFDLYNSQALAILERAGIETPTQFQINSIEQLLKTK